MSQAVDGGGDELADVAGEVDKDRQQGTQLDDGGEGSARIGPTEEVGDDAKVSGAADRQKLGEALDDTEQECFKDGH